MAGLVPAALLLVALAAPLMSRTANNLWLHRFAVLTVVATLALIGLGGLVTSHGVGMAVPDWPTTYGYNMFFFPISQWLGGIFYEHTHRLVASFVGFLVVLLTRWLGGKRSRLPLALIGLGGVVAGLALLQVGPEWKGAGYFLSGIGGLVLLVAGIWARNEPAARPLPMLGWLAFVTVQLQGLLGGLRVVLFKDQLGVFHATLAQIFFVLVCSIAFLSSRSWLNSSFSKSFARNHQFSTVLFTSVTLLILAQLILGSTMRHQHAGLAIRDFPLAYGKIWPAMDAASVAQYNQARMEVTEANPITAFQIGLQMAHRLMAILILAGVGFCAWWMRKSSLRRLGSIWLGLILAQVALGAATIWSNKAADFATAHVLVGALSLAFGAVISIISLQAWAAAPQTAISPVKITENSFGQRPAAATGLE